jgi:hypothetical protein
VSQSKDASAAEGSRIRLLQGSTPPAAALGPGRPPQRRMDARSRRARGHVSAAFFTAFSAAFSAAIAPAHGVTDLRHPAATGALRDTKRLQPGAIRGTHDIATPAAATTAFRSHRRDRPLDMETP